MFLLCLVNIALPPHRALNHMLPISYPKSSFTMNEGNISSSKSDFRKLTHLPQLSKKTINFCQFLKGSEMRSG